MSTKKLSMFKTLKDWLNHVKNKGTITKDETLICPGINTDLDFSSVQPNSPEVGFLPRW